MKAERSKTLNFDVDMKSLGAYIYPNPDTGRKERGKKPPDRMYVLSGVPYVIEFKEKNEIILPHQEKHLRESHEAGAHSYVARFYDDRILFVSMDNRAFWCKNAKEFLEKDQEFYYGNF